MSDITISETKTNTSDGKISSDIIDSKISTSIVDGNMEKITEMVQEGIEHYELDDIINSSEIVSIITDIWGKDINVDILDEEQIFAYIEDVYDQMSEYMSQLDELDESKINQFNKKLGNKIKNNVRNVLRDVKMEYGLNSV